MHPELFSAGTELVDWIAQGGRPLRGGQLWRWLYRWRGWFFQQSLRMLDRNHAAKPEPAPSTDGNGLIFVMGFWRSGTTLLHELLATHPRFGALLTWQCMNPANLLLGSDRIRGKTMVRPMDRMVITPTSPQEDEFALMAMGVPSLYRGFIDPRRLPELYPLLQQETWQADPCRVWHAAFSRFLHWCWKPEWQGAIIKSPNHVFRVRSVMSRFPAAKLIWVLRTPKDLWSSNKTMWSAMIDRYGLWVCSAEELDAFLLEALERYADALRCMAAHFSKGLHIFLRFEDLANDPRASLQRITGDLGIGVWQDWDKHIAGLLREKQGYKPSRHTEPSETENHRHAQLFAEIEDLHASLVCLSNGGLPLTS